MEAIQNARILPFNIGVSITVYKATGFDMVNKTGDLATLFDIDGNALANPYTATVYSAFFHRADTGIYHVKVGGTGSAEDLAYNLGQPSWIYYVVGTDAEAILASLALVASTTVVGRVELATAEETTAGTDAERAVTPAGLKVELDKKAPLASPALTGNPTAPTPAQFDNDTTLATTEFVQRALGNMAGVRVLTASETLQPIDSGKAILANIAENGVIGLPPYAEVLPGTKFYLQCGVATPKITVNAPAGMSFASPNVGGSTSSVNIIQPGVASEFIYLSEKTILATNGAGVASLAPSGYQKLPSGLIIQWSELIIAANATSTITFPLAFPNSCLGISTAHIQETGQGSHAITASPSTTGVSVKNQFSGSIEVRVIATGY